MTKEQMIEEIAKIQYFIKTNIYNDIISDKVEYIEKIKNVYVDMNIDEVKDNLDEVKYLGVGAIKLNIKEKIETICADKKLKAYEEYLNICKDIELEMESELTINKELKYLTVDSLIQYITLKANVDIIHSQS